MLVVNIIGAGHLGKTLGYLFNNYQVLKIGAICNRSQRSAVDASTFIGDGKACASIHELPSADITFITTPDDLITPACVELSKSKHLKARSIIVHCSGLLTSDALIAAKERGCLLVSIHPMRSFAEPSLSVEHYNPTYCAMEGDESGLTVIEALFKSIGSITYLIDKKKKSFYHASGVFAANYVVTLAEQARTCLKEAGVEQALAMDVITNLMRGTVANLAKTGHPSLSLTGPIERCDLSTIKQHLASLTHTHQDDLYALLGKATLPLTNHNDDKKEQIRAVFNTLM